MVKEQIKNLAISTLTNTIAILDATVTVDNASKFPTEPEFRIKIDSEILLVTSVSGSNFTVLRGIEGSSPTGHTSGATVKLVLTVDSFEKSIKQEYQTNVAATGIGIASVSLSPLEITYAIDLDPPLTQYLPGTKIIFKANFFSVGRTLVNVNGLGNKVVKKVGDQDLEPLDIQTNQVVTIVYDGDDFQLLPSGRDSDDRGICRGHC